MDLNKAIGQNTEDRCIRCTIDKNISMWFDNWENDLVELGFAMRNPTTRKIAIAEEQWH